MAVQDNTTALRSILEMVKALPSAGAGGAAYGKAVFFGDSISVGMNNSDYSFVDILSESGVFESVTKRAYSGATIGPYSGDNAINQYCLVNQVTRYESDVRNSDIIFLEYGGNDMVAIGAGRMLPGFDTDSENTTSICGYTRKALNLIRGFNPKARIVWLAMRRWKGQGLDKIYSSTPGLSDFLLNFEATVYRVVSEYNCSIIELTDGFNINEFLTSDGIHPTTEGHRLIAQNVIANMFSNTKFPRLVKKLNFNVNSQGEASVDAELMATWALIESGYVDVYGVATVPDVPVPLLLRCVVYDSDGMVFMGNGLSGSNTFMHFGFSWTANGVTAIMG